MLSPRLPLLVLLTLASGCASTLSTLQTAVPLERGQVQVSAGLGAYAPLGTILDVGKLGKDQARRIKDHLVNGEDYSLTEEDQQALLGAGIALAVEPPGVNYEFMARTGVARNLDAGIRYSSTSLRLDAKYRLLHGGEESPELNRLARTSKDLAIGLAVSKQVFSGPLVEALSFVHLDDFSRWDVEVPVYASFDVGDAFKVYAAPKYVYSHTTIEQTLQQAEEQAGKIVNLPGTVPSKVTGHFWGSTFGVAVGYRYVHLFAELTGGYTSSKANVLGRERNLGGVTLYPAFGLAIKTDPPSVRAAPAAAPGT
ncbi:hypothetical protein FGE12_01005 [Aggregicoccus sp. 17bor-14]|uniref:hypothetical protein n=1 Tax=Myxococcaceae TaxID=31 RepID=UPI00129C93A0|nr:MULTISPECIES: hypothetical protein [Myxococcaceae]MBF5040951.1 hypothetical protein [Simulacricoccus sp. 17bor-14]MRI86739.1 hypothetical protein [Aggregicoccus sp. 17bor-14]